MLTAAALAAAGVAAWVVVRWGYRLAEHRRALGIAVVTVSELAQHVGRSVRFRHPTDRRHVEGQLLNVGDSPLSAAWAAVTVQGDDGRRVVYQLVRKAKVEVDAGGRLAWRRHMP